MFAATSPGFPSVGDLSYKAPVQLAMRAALPLHTRTGNVLTAVANGSIGSIDEVVVTAGMRILVTLQGAAPENNGLYVVTSAGSAGTPWVFTRSADADTPAEAVQGSVTFCVQGALHAGTRWVATGAWVLNVTDPIWRTDGIQIASFPHVMVPMAQDGTTGFTILSDGVGAATTVGLGVRNDANLKVLLDAIDGLKLGPGAATALDVRLRRSAAKTVQLDDTAGGALALLDLLAAPIKGAVPVVNVYAASTTWTPPAGLLFALVEVQGGGGGSGGTAATVAAQAACSGGGGAGGYARKLLLASALSGNYTVTVGAGGAGGAAGANNGVAGNLSSFAGAGITTIQGNGGGLGASGPASGASRNDAGGDGGTATGGDVNLTGGGAGNGAVFAATQGGTANGGGGPLGNATRAGFSAAGANGRTYGGGASGASSGASAAARAGGTGGAGVVIVTEFYGP